MERATTAFDVGKAAAMQDAAAGSLTYQWRGHAGHFGHWFALQLIDRFQIGTDGLGSCFVSEASISYADGYNTVLANVLDARYGDDTVTKLFSDARCQSAETLVKARDAWLPRNGNSGSFHPRMELVMSSYPPCLRASVVNP